MCCRETAEVLRVTGSALREEGRQHISLRCPAGRCAGEGRARQGEGPAKVDAAARGVGGSGYC